MTTTPTHQPESIETARARYHLALAQIYELEDQRNITPPHTPGNKPEHVFDFDDGIRLIVSREQMAGEDPVIHVSASFDPGRSFYRLIRRTCSSIAEAQAMLRGACEARWREISGSAAPMQFLGFSPGKGVPHWWVRP